MATIATERQTVQNKIAEICAQWVPWNNIDSTIRSTHIRRIERSCFNKAIDECDKRNVSTSFTEPMFVGIYSAECSRIIANLDCVGNVGSSYLIGAIVDGSVNPMTIADMTTHDLCPEASMKEIDEIDIRSKQSIERNHCGVYRCGKCGESKTEYIEHQTRSADEPATLTVTCMVCYNSWRVA